MSAEHGYKEHSNDQQNGSSSNIMGARTLLGNCSIGSVTINVNPRPAGSADNSEDLLDQMLANIDLHIA